MTLPFLSAPVPGAVLPLLAVAVAAAALFWLRHAGRDGQGWAGSLVKTGSVALLVPAAALAGAPLPVLAGLALGSVGDFALSRPGRRWFLAGMGAFAAGHLCYAWAMADPAGVRAAVLVPGLALLALGASTEAWLAPHAGDLRGPVRAYVAVIVLMGLAALTAAPSHPLMAVGAGLFILSDLVLAIALFRAGSARARLVLGRLLWPAYWLGRH